MVAVPTGGERQVIHPAGVVDRQSLQLRHQDAATRCSSSGLVSRNGKDNSVVEGDMTDADQDGPRQRRARSSKAAGMTFDNVVASRVYITDGTKFQEMNKAYVTYFPKEPPARATVIAPLLGPQYQVEITLTASSAAEAGVHHAGRRRHARQAEPDAEQRHQGRQPPLRGRAARQQRRDQGQHRAQTKEMMARVERTHEGWRASAGATWSTASSTSPTSTTSTR